MVCRIQASMGDLRQAGLDRREKRLSMAVPGPRVSSHNILMCLLCEIARRKAALQMLCLAIKLKCKAVSFCPHVTRH